jgi:hypothetical protein
MVKRSGAWVLSDSGTLANRSTAALATAECSPSARHPAVLHWSRCQGSVSLMMLPVKVHAIWAIQANLAESLYLPRWTSLGTFPNPPLTTNCIILIYPIQLLHCHTFRSKR